MRLKLPFFNRLPFLQNGKHSLAFLNSAQFLGVINDNIFKLVIAFLLIDKLGSSHASEILSAAGAIYVIPFLLFSSSAGILADRFSKQKLLVFMKSAEMIIMILAIFAFAAKTQWACYSLLFLLATHSAMFGPSKYGIIPELVLKEDVSRANGLITSFTYLAIILGTFLASFLTEITGRHFVFIALFCFIVAMLGFVSTFGIKRTPEAGSDKKVNFFFVREIYQTLVFCKQKKHLLPSIFGSAYFLFIGAYTQLNIIPFGIQALNLPEVGGGYLFLATALGIALGSYLAGRLSRKRVEIGLSCLSGLFIAVVFLLLFVFAHSLTAVAILLALLGIFGGIFIVPFDSFIQVNSPDEKRGQVIAAANFLSFAGVLIASLVLYLFSQIFDLSAASGFAMMGIITLLTTFILTARLADFAIPFFAKRFVFPFLSLQFENLELAEKSKASFLVLENGTPFKAFLALASLPNLELYIPYSRRRASRTLLSLFPCLHFSNIGEDNLEEFFRTLPSPKERALPCLYLSGNLPCRLLEPTRTLIPFFKKQEYEFLFVRLERDKKNGKRILSLSRP